MTPRLIARWAEDTIPANIQDPGLAQELSGYDPDQELPRDEINFLFRQFCRGALVTDALEYGADLEVGRSILVDEYRPDLAPLAEQWASSVNAATAHSMATDGKYIYVGASDAATIRAYARGQSGADSSSFAWEYDTGAAGPVIALSTDGRLVVGAAGDTIYVLLTDGTFLGSWSRPSTTSDAITGLYAYGNGKVLWCGERTQSSKTHGHITITESAFAVSDDWSADHGATLNAICTDGVTYGYACGADDGSGHTLISFLLSAGTETLTSTAHAAALRSIALGKDRLYAGGDDDGGVTLRSFARIDLSAIGTFQTVGAVLALGYSGDLLAAGTDNNTQTIVLLDPLSGYVVAAADLVPTASSVKSLVLDGVALYVGLGTETASPKRVVRRLNTLQKPRTFRRVAHTDQYRRPVHRLLLPVDAW